MKRTVAITLVVLVAAAAAWSAYAYAQGGGPLKWAGAVTHRPACEPATRPCHRSHAYHDGAACDCDAGGCPNFQDVDSDGRCDVAGNCGRHGHFGRHDGAGRCGRMDPGHACGWHGKQ